MIDAHAHLDRYGDRLPLALEQIRTLRVRTLAVSMDPDSYRTTREIAEDEPWILPSFGVHPWEAPRYVDELSLLAEPLAEAVAIGEIGLDRHFVEDEAQYPAQQTVFEHLLDAAESTGRLVNLHTTGAEQNVLELLQSRSLPAIIIHWYSGPIELVDAFLELGAYFTIGVEIVRSDTIRTLARRIPADRLLTETDNPGGWEWMTGDVGFPELIERVEAELARVRGVPRVELTARLGANLEALLAAGGLDGSTRRTRA